MGLIPDLATLRDRAHDEAASSGSTGASPSAGAARNRHWQHYEVAYLILAGLSTPLVLSVHSIVSLRLRRLAAPRLAHHDLPALLRGRRHLLRLRHGDDADGDLPQVFGLEHLITMRHLDNMTKIILATGSMVGYAYGMEFFIAWYSGNPYELFVFMNRAFGPYAWAYWTMITCNVLVPAALLVQEGCATACRSCSSSRSSSTSGCGSSAS